MDAGDRALQPLGQSLIQPLIQRYLDHARYEKRLATRTLALYTEHLTRLQGLADTAGLARNPKTQKRRR